MIKCSPLMTDVVLFKYKLLLCLAFQGDKGNMLYHEAILFSSHNMQNNTLPATGEEYFVIWLKLACVARLVQLCIFWATTLVQVMICFLNAPVLQKSAKSWDAQWTTHECWLGGPSWVLGGL